MRRFALQAALAGVLLAPASALAQGAGGLSGFYAGISGGAGLLFDQDIDTDVTINGLGIESGTSVEYDPAFRFSGFVGYQLNTSVRVQVDVSYMSADATNILEVGADELELDQKTKILSGTAGIFFDLWPVGTFVPYIGAGAGVAQVKATIDGGGSLGDSKQTVLTAFGEAGLPFNLTPELAIVPSARLSWYNTKEETDDAQVVNLLQIIEFDAGSIGENLYETQFLISARYTF